MLINRIELRLIKMELVSPFKTSMGTELFEEHIIVKIESEGLTGWGECPVEPAPLYSYETVETAWHMISDIIVPQIIGKELQSIEDYTKLVGHFRGHRMAKAGVEFALSDLFAKADGISLSEYLGGNREKIEVGVSIGIQASPKKLLEDIDGYLKKGYKRIKIKIEPGNDIEFVKSVRAQYHELLLQVDANSAYTLKDMALLKAIDDYNLLLIEQPLGYEDIFEHSKLQRELKTDICLDESIHSLADTKAAIELGSCRIINFKPARVGGYVESKLIHDYCASKNVPVWHGGMLESGIGRAGNIALASLPNFILPGDISASDRYFKEDIVDPPFVLNSDGMMEVPTLPGIGVNVLIDKLDRVTSRKTEYKL